MNPTIIIRPYLLAFLIASTCIATPIQAGLISKGVVFLAGAIVGGPYIHALRSQPYRSFSLLHQAVWPEVGNNVSFVWNKAQKCVISLKQIARKQLHALEEQRKENNTSDSSKTS